MPDEEWKIIEAISDSHLSTVDQRTRKVIDGPLKAIEKYISVIQAKRVKVLAMILGEERSYWLAVDRPEGEALSEEGEAGTMTVDDIGQWYRVRLSRLSPVKHSLYCELFLFPLTQLNPNIFVRIRF